jgi:hypothetical protein
MKTPIVRTTKMANGSLHLSRKSLATASLEIAESQMYACAADYDLLL